MLLEQPPKLPLAHADAAGKGIHGSVVQRAHLHQRQRPRNRVGGAAPGAEVGRGFWPATEARPKTRLMRGGGGGKEGDVLRLWRPGRANGTAINTGRFDPGKQTPIETRIAASNRAVAGVVVEIKRAGPHQISIAMTLGGGLLFCFGHAVTSLSDRRHPI
jgi:hypothetical protein